ncbi:glycosyltransferase family 8 protein [Flagelloscypha sp. PMI_526]|nr:glycosyltransferase family 8 protein [Flagelloscypha sp. PMI_526]
MLVRIYTPFGLRLLFSLLVLSVLGVLLRLLHTTVVFRLPSDEWNQGPLVHYSSVNPFPALQDEFSPTVEDERAFVTSLYSDTYAHAVATLGHSLERQNVKSRRIVMYIADQVSEAALCIVRTQGWELLPINRIAPPHNGHHIHGTFIDQYTKLQLWSFDTLGIRSLVYMDADMLLLRPIDHQFLFDTPFNFAAVPDNIDSPLFNAGMLVLKPDSRVYRDLLVKMTTAEFNLEWAEQTFLNLYFGMQAFRLPWIFNANVWIKKSSPNLWEAMKDEMTIIHYTSAKPFPPYHGGLLTWEEMEYAVDQKIDSQPDWEEELLWWKDTWSDMRDQSFEELAQCVPSRNEAGSIERLRKAGVPIERLSEGRGYSYFGVAWDFLTRN